MINHPLWPVFNKSLANLFILHSIPAIGSPGEAACGWGCCMKRLGLTALGAMALALGGCTTTKQVQDLGFRPPEGSYKMIVMRPDVSVGLLTAGGSVEPRQDWTDQARTSLLAALTTQQAGHGGAVKIAATREETGADPQLVADLDQLHVAVGGAIVAHKYGLATLRLPTKDGAFDWTLGEEAVSFGTRTGYDYALFLHASDSFASSGRVALQAVSLLGCAVGVCMMPHGGEQAAYASLVDLHTGRVVWFNVLHSSVGDIRTPDGAATMVNQLLDKMKPGKDVRSAAKQAT